MHSVPCLLPLSTVTPCAGPRPRRCAWATLARLRSWLSQSVTCRRRRRVQGCPPGRPARALALCGTGCQAARPVAGQGGWLSRHSWWMHVRACTRVTGWGGGGMGVRGGPPIHGADAMVFDTVYGALCPPRFSQRVVVAPRAHGRQHGAGSQRARLSCVTRIFGFDALRMRSLAANNTCSAWMDALATDQNTRG